MYTQEELEAKSDFELDGLVCKKEGYGWYSKPDDPRHCTGGWEYCDYVYDKEIELPNYCHSWADMGPIINEIWLELKEVIYIDGFGDARIWDYMIDHCSGNKLRAAAIVYLLME